MSRKERRAARGQAASRQYAAALDAGNLALQNVDAPAALNAFLQAIEREPARLQAHYGLCSALMLQGQFAQAAAHMTEVLALKPDYVDGLCLIANAHIGAGDPRRALAAARKAFALADTAPVRSLLANCLRNLETIPNDPEMRAVVARAIAEPWDRPINLLGHAIDLLRGDPAFAGIFDPAPEGEILLAPLEASALLRAVLENTLAANVALERALTRARGALLRAAESAEWTADRLAFAGALARQCFTNEYVFAMSAEEAGAAARLRERCIAALDAGSALPPQQLAVLASYHPLHELPAPERLLAGTWPAPVDALLTRQVREPAQEERLRAAMPQLTPIEDAVSQLVRGQYEQSPYPRWVKPPPPGRPAPIDQIIRQNFPYPDLPYRPIEKQSLDLLVAGCGTGQQLFDLAQRIAGARILAIDLSRASLAFARRQAEAHRLVGIEFGQADILALGTLGRSFDMIDCGGVLHHLADPLAGWRVLAGLLRRNGLMHIALYSERARAAIVAAQQRAKAQGYRGTPADIRAFRQELMREPASDIDAPARNGDFFSLSTCRDLLFHVQEHRFTLPRIADFLAASGLRLVGMDAALQVRRAYTARFPDDRTLTDLANWDRFEQAQPKTFVGMYQFWVQRT
jgi:SAM-dependent methyltransferase/tetratricopeptide (TPR) repeat protein